MSEKVRILVVDDEPLILESLSLMLERSGYYVKKAPDALKALALMEEYHIDIVLTDLSMPDMDGLEFQEKVGEKYPHVPVIFLTAHSTVGTAVKAIKLGAYDYIEKPCKSEQLLSIIDKLINEKKLCSRTGVSAGEHRKLPRFENIIGNTTQMHNVFDEIRSVANTDISVLIVGENGTGKELVANAIHYGSSRKDKPFIKVNCGAIAESVVESELFGHEKGAFTGAVRDRKGMFEMADKGTFFLDEIGELSTSTQIKLLRVLETWEFQRVGSSKVLKSNFRFVCATNKDLPLAIINKEFREDLYYRINTAIIHLPSLRERKADIPLLADFFLKKTARQMKKNVRSISKESMRLLMKHEWPGNIRELSHAIERGVTYCKGIEIIPDNLPREIRNMAGRREIASPDSAITLSAVESSHIYNILVDNNWNMRKTADTLNISRSTLYKKLEKYKLSRPR